MAIITSNTVLLIRSDSSDVSGGSSIRGDRLGIKEKTGRIRSGDQVKPSSVIDLTDQTDDQLLYGTSRPDDDRRPEKVDQVCLTELTYVLRRKNSQELLAFRGGNDTTQREHRIGEGLLAGFVVDDDAANPTQGVFEPWDFPRRGRSIETRGPHTSHRIPRRMSHPDRDHRAAPWQDPRPCDTEVVDQAWTPDIAVCRRSSRNGHRHTRDEVRLARPAPAAAGAAEQNDGDCAPSTVRPTYRPQPL